MTSHPHVWHVVDDRADTRELGKSSKRARYYMVLSTQLLYRNIATLLLIVSKGYQTDMESASTSGSALASTSGLASALSSGEGESKRIPEPNPQQLLSPIQEILQVSSLSVANFMLLVEILQPMLICRKIHRLIRNQPTTWKQSRQPSRHHRILLIFLKGP